MLTPNELNSAIFKDVGYAAEYSAGLMRLNGTYTVFVAWPHVKAALTTVHGQKAFNKFETHLRSRFVSVYQKTLEKNENTKMLHPLTSLKNNRQFKVVQDSCKPVRTKNFLVFMLPNGLDESRLGVTVSNHVVNSPGRRRIKRLVREVFRLNTNSFISKDTNVDFVVIARQTEYEHTYQSVLNEINRVLGK